jgi:hypothetical protein
MNCNCRLFHTFFAMVEGHEKSLATSSSFLSSLHTFFAVAEGREKSLATSSSLLLAIIKV